MNSCKTTTDSIDPMPPLRILCIDDNRDVADSTVALLRIVGFDARACYSGKDALREAIAFQPIVCLIDLNMPQMDGDILAIRLKEQCGEELPILIAITAMSNEASSRRIKNAGFDMHLLKPIEPNKLLEVVDLIWQSWQRKLARHELKSITSTEDHPAASFSPHQRRLLQTAPERAAKSSN